MKGFLRVVGFFLVLSGIYMFSYYYAGLFGMEWQSFIWIVIWCVIFLWIILYFVAKKVQKRNMSKTIAEFEEIQQKNLKDELSIKLSRIPSVRAEIRAMLLEFSDKFEDYKKQVAVGHDKYQVGRALGRMCWQGKEKIDKSEIKRRRFEPTDSEDVRKLKEQINQQCDEVEKEFNAFVMLVDEFCKMDVVLENGFEDFASEQENRINQEKIVVNNLEEKKESQNRINDLEKQIVELKKQNADTNKQLGNYMKCAACVKRDNCWMKMHKSMRDVCSGPF